MAERTIQVTIKGQNLAGPAFRSLGDALGSLGSAVTSPVRALGGLTDMLGKVGLAGLGLQQLAGTAKAAGQALGVGLAVEAENVAAQFMAFTKDATKTKEILALVRAEADKTPFSFQAMSAATAGLMPAAKAANEPLMDLVRTAEILAASNPAQGLEGAAFALREAVSGDFTSVIERFNLPRSHINQLKAEGIPALEAVRRAMTEMGYDIDLVAGLASTASGKWSTFQDAIDGVKLLAATPILESLKGELDRFSGVLERHRERLADFAGVIGEGLGGAIEYLGGIVERVLDGDVSGALQTLLGTAQEIGSGLLGQFAQWGQALLDWIAPRIEPMLAALGDLAARLWDWIVAQAPPLLARLAQWGEQLWAWVEPMIPPLLTELGGLAAQLYGWVLEQIPVLAAKFGEWYHGYIAWLLEAFSRMLPELLKLVSSILRWIGDNGPALVEKFLAEWLPAMLVWVAQAAIMVVPKLVEFAAKIVWWIVTEGVPLLVEGAIKLGAAIVTGIVKGLWNLAGQLFGAMGELLRGTIKRGEETVGAHSPAKEFERIGEDIDRGLIRGIENLQGEAADAAAELGADVLAAVTETAGTVEREWDSLLTTFRRQRSDMGAELDTLAVDFGEQVPPIKAALLDIDVAADSLLTQFRIKRAGLSTELAQLATDAGTSLGGVTGSLDGLLGTLPGKVDNVRDQFARLNLWTSLSGIGPGGRTGAGITGLAGGGAATVVATVGTPVTGGLTTGGTITPVDPNKMLSSHMETRNGVYGEVQQYSWGAKWIPHGPAKKAAAGGAGIVRAPTLFLAGDAGPEAFAFTPLPAAAAGAGIPAGSQRLNLTVVLELDGQRFARAIAPDVQTATETLLRLRAI